MIYAMCFEKTEQAWTTNLVFDIDYIFKWLHPIKAGDPFSFSVAPCTLIFEEALGLVMNLDTDLYALEGLEISDLKLIKRSDKAWTIDFIGRLSC